MSPRPEHRGAVGDDRDHVALEREVEGLQAVLGDRLADPGDAGHVGDREVVAGLERARAWSSRSCRPGASGRCGRTRRRRGRRRGPPPRRRSTRRAPGREALTTSSRITDLCPAAHQVDGADVAAHLADRRRELAEQVGLGGVHLDAEGDAVLGARGDGQRGLLGGVGGGRSLTGRQRSGRRGYPPSPAPADTAAPPATAPLLLIDGNSLAYRAFLALPGHHRHRRRASRPTPSTGSRR